MCTVSDSCNRDHHKRKKKEKNKQKGYKRKPYSMRVYGDGGVV
jgi:hypothetical protein